MIKHDHTFQEKIKLLEEVTQILKDCAKQLRDNSQSINQNVHYYDKEIPTIQTDVIHHNLAERILDIDKLDETHHELKRRYTNDFILQKGDILFDATEELAEIDGQYKKFFENKEISSIWFLTTDMSKINQELEIILSSTKPSLKNAKIKKASLT